jgi:signal transduction histidine kinase
MFASFFNTIRSLRILVSIIVVLLIVVSIYSFYFFQNNSLSINNIAIENVKENSELLTEELATSLKNKMETITVSLQIISNSPSIKANLISAVPLLEEADNATRNLTAFYGWTNKTGNIQWSTLFSENKELHNKFLGADVSSRAHFAKVKSTLTPYFTPVIPSLLNISTIFVSYPILLAEAKEGEENYNNNNHNNTTIADAFQRYSPENIFDIVKEHQEEASKNNEFHGTVYAGINMTTMVKLLETQVFPKNRSSISLLDRDGVTIYSANKGLDKIILDNQEKNKDFIEKEFDQENKQLIYQLKDRILSSSALSKEEEGEEGEEIKSIEIKDKSGNVSSTISYTPISVNGQIVFYLMVDTTHEFAKEIDNLMLEQNDFAIDSIILIGIATFLVVVIIGVFNNNLQKAVQNRTRELKISVNALKEANEQLKIHDKMQQEFVNITAHELRTPTQSIMGYVEMIKLFPEKTPTYLQPIERNTQRLYRLIQDILDITKIESGTLKLKKTTFDMNEKINNVIRDFTIKKDVNNNHNSTNQNIKFIFQPTKEPIIVFADKERIYQVISNLIRNALKFIPSTNGKIEITLEKKESNRKEYAFVKIKDNGKGIDKEVLPRLFEKFASKSESGTGLGLYIAKSIVEAHGGRIWGKNDDDGIGAEFGFTILLHSN